MKCPYCNSEKIAVLLVAHLNGDTSYSCWNCNKKFKTNKFGELVNV